MKTMHDEQRELLEDIFTPEGSEGSMSAREVMKLVDGERKTRGRRRRGIAAVAVAIVALAGGWISVQTPTRPAAKPRLADTPPRTPAPATVVASTAITTPSVEHVNDEEMLAMLGKQPTALVRWPDGRQTLLLLAK